MIINRVYVLVLVSLLLFQSWSVVNAVIMDMEVVASSHTQMDMSDDEHDCCDDTDQSLACEIHCFSGLSATLVSAPIILLLPKISAKPAFQLSQARLARVEALYRPPIA